MKKTIHMETVIEIFISVFCGVLLLYQVFTDGYIRYVAPKIKPFLLFAGVLFILIGFSRVKDLYSCHYQKNYRRYFILCIPILVLCMPHKPLTTRTAGMKLENQGWSSNSEIESGQSQVGSTYLNEEDPYVAGTEQSLTDPTSESATKAGGMGQSTKLTGLDKKKKQIVVSDEQFYQWLNELTEHMEQYRGYEIVIKGQEMRDETMDENQFAIARLAMVCCLADMVPVGLYCNYKDLSEIKKDKWYTVTGVVDTGTIDGQENILIQVKKLKEEKEPEEPYVYPY